MSRYKRLANKSHRLHIRQFKRQRKIDARKVHDTVRDYEVRENVRRELILRQYQPHWTIANHMTLPLWVIEQECQNVSYSSGHPCPHPKT